MAHSRYEISDTGPVVGDAVKPLKHRMRNIELVIERALIVLLGDLLARQQTLLRDKDLAVLVEGYGSKHDVLCAIGKFFLAALSKECESQTDDT
jgi:hypothetical protein